MGTVVRFIKPYGLVKCSPNVLVESKGPQGNEGFCHFSTTTATAPHMDLFSNVDSNTNNIILSGATEYYSIPSYSTQMDSICQYFLEHPTRTGIQYLIWNDGSGEYGYKPVCPGIIYDGTTGKILGRLKTHRANSNGKVVFETPFDSSDVYTFSGLTPSQSGHLYEFNVSGSSPVEITVSAGGISESFNVYPNSYSTGAVETYEIKNVNMFGDYVIAAQLTPANLASVFDYIVELEEDPGVNYAWCPKHFKSIYLWTFSETVRNITPNIYKMPAALVPDGNDRILMINAVGISANNFLKE